MKIVVSASAGDIQIDSEPVNYFWNPLNNVTGLLAWVILAAGFVLFKENRRRQALWILVPVVVIKGLWAGVAAALGISSSEAVIFAVMLDVLLISFALIWMLADRLGRFNRGVRFLLETAVFCLIGAVLISRLGFGYESIIVSVLCIIVWSVILSALWFGRFMCRRRFGAIRFCAWAGVWILVTMPLLVLIFAAIEIQNLGDLIEAILEVLTVALIFAGICIVGLLPFEILLFKNAFWRGRFEKLMGIQTKTFEEVTGIREAQEPLTANQ